MNTQSEVSRRILIVEDDDLIRRAVRMVLEWEGYQVDCANNGQEALDYLSAGNRPCLIILDLMMPVLDGEHFRQAQLQDPRIASIPVIVVSGCPTASTVDAVHHVQKPFEVQELLDAIREQLVTPLAKKN